MTTKSDENVVVMDAKPEDLDACIACIPPEWGGATNQWALSRIGFLLHAERLWVAVKGGYVVGMTGWDTTFAANALYLGFGVVHPEERNQHVASQLVEHAVKFGRAHKHRLVLGDVRSDQQVVIDGMKRRGFTQLGAVTNLHADGFEWLILGRALN